MPAMLVSAERSTTEEGTSTKPLYIKHLAMSDWNIIMRLREQLGNKNVADVIRFAIRKAGGAI